MPDTTSEQKVEPGVTAPIEPVVDLEKIRDEKVMPLAREMLKDVALAVGTLNEDQQVDIETVVLKSLSRTLESDLNIVSDIPYLFQLVLGAFTALNKTTQECETESMDDSRYGRVAQKVLSMVCEANITLGDVKQEQTTADFAPIKEKLNDLFKAESLSKIEVRYVMDSIFEAFKQITGLYNRSIEESTEQASAKLFGIETMNDLTIGKLNEVLTKGKQAEVMPEAPVVASKEA